MGFYKRGLTSEGRQKVLQMARDHVSSSEIVEFIEKNVTTVNGNNWREYATMLEDNRALAVEMKNLDRPSVDAEIRKRIRTWDSTSPW